MLNLGIVSSTHVQLIFAYGFLRSSSTALDALCLAVQGAALGILFGYPMTGCFIGAVMALSDRILIPLVNKLPGRSSTLVSFPIGVKNVSLALGSFGLSSAIFYLAKTGFKL
jgi:hypothetical protein